MMKFSEAIKLKDGILYNLEYHQDRVNKTALDFYKKSIDISVIKKMIPDNAGKGIFKCRLVYGDEIKVVEFIPYTFRKVNRVGVIVDNEIEYSYKYTDRSCITNLLESSGYDDIIIIKNGLVTDSSASNLVFESSEGLFTPEDYLLPGTKRKYYIDNGKITERRITIDNIRDFEKLYFINAMTDLEDKIMIDLRSQLDLCR